MDQTLAIVILVVLSLVTANLPFVLERPMVVLPWRSPGGRFDSGVARWFESLAFFVVLAALAAGTLFWIGQGLLSPMGMLLRVAVMVVLVVVLLLYPRMVARDTRDDSQVVPKSFFDRFVEVLVFYALVGVLAFAFEASMGNVFAQRWEFYAITLSLFLVMAYPGFVYRYLMRRRSAQTSLALRQGR